MATDLTIRLSETLLEQVQATAQAEGKTVDQVMEEAALQLLESKRRSDLSKRWGNLSERGQRRAAEMGLSEEDVPRLIAESRRER